MGSIHFLHQGIYSNSLSAELKENKFSWQCLGSEVGKSTCFQQGAPPPLLSASCSRAQDLSASVSLENKPSSVHGGLGEAITWLVHGEGNGWFTAPFTEFQMITNISLCLLRYLKPLIPVVLLSLPSPRLHFPFFSFFFWLSRFSFFGSRNGGRGKLFPAVLVYAFSALVNQLPLC